MTTKRFVSTLGTHALSGEWSFAGHGPDAGPSVLVVPHGAVLPAVTHDDGQLFFIPTSGVLAMTIGGAWKVATSGV